MQMMMKMSSMAAPTARPKAQLGQLYSCTSGKMSGTKIVGAVVLVIEEYVSLLTETGELVLYVGTEPEEVMFAVASDVTAAIAVVSNMAIVEPGRKVLVSGRGVVGKRDVVALIVLFIWRVVLDSAVVLVLSVVVISGIECTSSMVVGWASTVVLNSRVCISRVVVS